MQQKFINNIKKWLITKLADCRIKSQSCKKRNFL